MASERAKYCVDSLSLLAKKHLDKQLKEEKGKEDQFLTLEQQKSVVEEEERKKKVIDFLSFRFFVWNCPTME